MVELAHVLSDGGKRSGRRPFDSGRPLDATSRDGEPMPMRPPTPCSYVGPPRCATLVYGGGGRCDEHKKHDRRASDRARRERDGGSLYGRTHRTRFRAGVLRKHPYCQCDRLDHPAHLGHPCLLPSTDADHWPLDKRALLAAGLDSDDPTYGRGLCHSCHSSSTARLQPGGWHRPTPSAPDAA